MTPKEHERLETRLLELLYDELPPGEAEAVRLEIAEHPDLEARLREWERVRHMTAALPEIELDPQVRYTLLRAARHAVDKPEPAGFWAWFGGVMPALSGAAVVMLAVAGVFTMTRGVDDRAPEAAPAVAEAEKAPKAAREQTPATGTDTASAPKKEAPPETTAKAPVVVPKPAGGAPAALDPRPHTESSGRAGFETAKTKQAEAKKLDPFVGDLKGGAVSDVEGRATGKRGDSGGDYYKDQKAGRSVGNKQAAGKKDAWRGPAPGAKKKRSKGKARPRRRSKSKKSASFGGFDELGDDLAEDQAKVAGEKSPRPDDVPAQAAPQRPEPVAAPAPKRQVEAERVAEREAEPETLSVQDASDDEALAGSAGILEEKAEERGVQQQFAPPPPPPEPESAPAPVVQAPAAAPPPAANSANVDATPSVDSDFDRAGGGQASSYGGVQGSTRAPAPSRARNRKPTAARGNVSASPPRDTDNVALGGMRGAERPRAAAVSSQLSIARTARRAGDHRTAVRNYEAFITGNKGHRELPSALYETAQSYEALGDHQRAMQLYKLVIRDGGRFAGRAAKRLDRLTAISSKLRRKKSPAKPKPAAAEADSAAEPADAIQSEPAKR